MSTTDALAGPPVDYSRFVGTPDITVVRLTPQARQWCGLPVSHTYELGTEMNRVR